mmetsp:Transcript_5365/g.14950  ORF Transcript_5365/g.14950 Transcript_5365/m.14950 type:complete len:348 (-) Transcript_5365:6-1049(-)
MAPNLLQPARTWCGHVEDAVEGAHVVLLAHPDWEIPNALHHGWHEVGKGAPALLHQLQCPLGVKLCQQDLMAGREHAVHRAMEGRVVRERCWHEVHPLRHATAKGAEAAEHDRLAAVREVPHCDEARLCQRDELGPAGGAAACGHEPAAGNPVRQGFGQHVRAWLEALGQATGALVNSHLWVLEAGHPGDEAGGSQAHDLLALSEGQPGAHVARRCPQLPTSEGHHNELNTGRQHDRYEIVPLHLEGSVGPGHPVAALLELPKGHVAHGELGPRRGDRNVLALPSSHGRQRASHGHHALPVGVRHGPTGLEGAFVAPGGRRGPHRSCRTLPLGTQGNVGELLHLHQR